MRMCRGTARSFGYALVAVAVTAWFASALAAAGDAPAARAASVPAAQGSGAPAPAPASSPATPATPAPAQPLDAGYAGDDTCVFCHETQGKTLKATLHGKAVDVRTPAATGHACETC